MGRRKEPPRLRRKRYANGSEFWIIRHEGRDHGTGCAVGSADQEAEAKLAKFIRDVAAGEDIARGQFSEDIPLATVMMVYLEKRAPDTNSHHLIHDHIRFLNDYWGGKNMSDINGDSCRAYAAFRTTRSMARRELETLRAAVNYYHKEYGVKDALPAITLPPKEQSRQRFLTRSEAARFLWAARRCLRLRRFILIGIYTGTRSGAIKALRWEPSDDAGWPDLEKGILYRRGRKEKETDKRRPPMKMPRKLIGHMRRWKRIDQANGHRHVIHDNGAPVQQMVKVWDRALVEAGLWEPKGKEQEKVVPHTLRHTRATWLAQAGVDAWKASKSLGMTLKMFEEVYGHHNPEFDDEAADAY